jgi:predicted nucleic acid-binding protein
LPAIEELAAAFDVVTFDLGTQRKALRLKARYQFQYYDALIVATALENGCDTLLSEDMQHGQKVEKSLGIVSPFR